MKNQYRLLIVEDSKTFSKLLVSLLDISETYAFSIKHAGTLAEAERILGEETFDAVILDLTLPDSMPENTFEIVNRLIPETAIIVSTGSRGNEYALDAVNKGAQDYLVKSGLTSEILCNSIAFGVQRKQLLLETAERHLFLEQKILNLENCVVELENEILRYQGRPYEYQNRAPETPLIPHPSEKLDKATLGPIMVVDDIGINVKVASYMLQKCGFTDLITATNGKDAVEKFRSSHPKVILMDIQMPEMDGISAASEIRKICGNSNPPVIMALTAAYYKSMEETCLKCGMNKVLSKPISFDVLRNAMASYVA